MPQIQQASSMPKEWYDQLYELAYGKPAADSQTENKPSQAQTDKQSTR
jgi:hypothetical protein